MSNLEQSKLRIKRAGEKLAELKTLAAGLREGEIQIDGPHGENAVWQKYFARYQETLPNVLILYQ
jgi:hypothetical protein